jgi:hypothetical protein
MPSNSIRLTPQEPPVDIGNDFGEIAEPGDAVAAVRPYAHTPDDLEDTLVEIRDAADEAYGRAHDNEATVPLRLADPADLRFDHLDEPEAGENDSLGSGLS